MERATALSNLNLLESVSSIPPDIQQCLLTIAQYGCRPDQVQRWYIMVREHFGCNAPPPVGNLYEHEIVVTPLLPTQQHQPQAPPQSTTAPESKALVAPPSRASSIASSHHTSTKNPHGLGLNLESARPASRPDYQITPSSDRGGMSVISPVSIASRADSAPELALIPMHHGAALSTPQPTPGTLAFPDCTPVTGTFAFNAPGFAGPQITPFLGLQGLDVASMSMTESPTSFTFDASAVSGGMDFFLPLNHSSTSSTEGPQAGPVVPTALATTTTTPGGSSTPALIPAPTFQQHFPQQQPQQPLLHTPESTPKRRRMASDDFADPVRRNAPAAAPFQQNSARGRAGRAPLAPRTPLQAPNRFPQQQQQQQQQPHPPPPPPPPTAVQVTGPFPQAPPMTRSPAQRYPASAPLPQPSPHFLPLDGPAAYPYHNVHHSNNHNHHQQGGNHA